ncbi:MAG TPA: HAMP domain-containing sensor histidine kinase [Pyrinomonadaceae bacterium]|nr:HAMP domain-containing sensor histidine kinase [Pyrinomonadaceae bacterium]
MQKPAPSSSVHCNVSAAKVDDTSNVEGSQQDCYQPLIPKTACCETAQTLGERIRALQILTASLSHAFTSVEVVRVLVNQVRSAVRASGATLLMKTGEAEGWEIAGVAGLTSEAINLCNIDLMNTRFPLAEVVTRGMAVWFESHIDVLRYYSASAAREALKGCRSMACLPLILERGVPAMLHLTFSEARKFNGAERAFILLFTAQCEQALGRARLYEAERLACKEAEQNNRTKDAFLATASHELRTPLTAILGWSRILSGQKPDPSTYVHGLETIERNARAQERLIDDLLDVIRIKTGKLRLHLGQVKLSRVIDSAIDSLRPLADAKHIGLQRITTSEAACVLGDWDRLQQVMWNLLSNAIKFTPRGGHVMVHLERVGSHMEIKVTDTGAGIDQNFLPYVFDPYRQPDESAIRSEGLGLGLAIVRQLVELHHGRVRAESSGKGQGSCITVSLPLTVASKASQVASGAVIKNQTGVSVGA